MKFFRNVDIFYKNDDRSAETERVRGVEFTTVRQEISVEGSGVRSVESDGGGGGE